MRELRWLYSYYYLDTERDRHSCYVDQENLNKRVIHVCVCGYFLFLTFLFNMCACLFLYRSRTWWVCPRINHLPVRAFFFLCLTPLVQSSFSQTVLTCHKVIYNNDVIKIHQTLKREKGNKKCGKKTKKKTESPEGWNENSTQSMLIHPKRIT